MTIRAADICRRIVAAIEALDTLGLRHETMPAAVAGSHGGNTFVIESAPITTPSAPDGSRVDGTFEMDVTILINWPDRGGQHEMSAVDVATAMEQIAVAVINLEDTDGDLYSIDLSGSANAGYRGGISRSNMTFTILYRYA